MEGEFDVLESSVFRRKAPTTSGASSPRPLDLPATVPSPQRVPSEVANGSSKSANQTVQSEQTEHAVLSPAATHRLSWVNEEAPIVEDAAPLHPELKKTSKSRSQASGSFGALSVEIPYVPLEQRVKPTEHESGSGGGRSLLSQLPPLLPKRPSPTTDANSSLNSPSNRTCASVPGERSAMTSRSEHFQEASSGHGDSLRGVEGAGVGAASTIENDEIFEPNEVQNEKGCVSVVSQEEATGIVEPCSSFRVDIRAAAFGMCRCGATQAAHSAQARHNARLDQHTDQRNEVEEKVNKFQKYIARTPDGNGCSARPYKPVGHRMEPQEEPKET